MMLSTGPALFELRADRLSWKKRDMLTGPESETDRRFTNCRYPYKNTKVL